MPLIRPFIVGICVVMSTSLVACREGGGVESQCAVVATTGPFELVTGQSAAAGATATCVGLDTPRLVWTSSAPAVATVDSVTGEVHGNAPGSATLHARVVGVAGSGADIAVVVTACTPGAGVSMSPQSLAVAVGGSARLVGAVVATPCTTPATIVYRSEDSTIARVDATGLVSGVRVGQTIVRATVPQNAALSAAAVVTVTATSGSVTVTPSFIGLIPGGSVQLRASASFGAQSPAGTDTSVTFRSDNACIATVSSTGIVTAQSVGSTTIVALARRDTTLRATVPVMIFFNGPTHFTLQSITTGTPAVAVDPGAVRGTIAVTLLVDPLVIPGGGRVDLTLAGRLAATANVAAPAANATAMVPVTLTLATDARDASGVRLYANGAQFLNVVLVPTPIPSAVPGCPLRNMQGEQVGATLTLANP